MNYITIKKAIRENDETVRVYTFCNKSISFNNKYNSKDYRKLLYTYMCGGKEYTDILNLDYDYIGKYNRKSNIWKIATSVHNGYCIIDNSMIKSFEHQLSIINEKIHKEIEEIELKRAEIVAKEDEDRLIADNFIEKINNHNKDVIIDNKDTIMDIVQQDMIFNHEGITNLIGGLIVIDDDRVKQVFKKYLK